MAVITDEQFAQWSFERDRDEELIEGEWGTLSEEDRDSYLEEARSYLVDKFYKNLGLPDDIVARAKRENVLLPLVRTVTGPV